MSSCIFCEIIEGHLPAFVIYEDEHYLAILDRFPIAKGHVLIIAKRHAPNIYSLSAEEAANLMPLVQKIASLLNSKLKPDGLNVLQNNGKAAGQVVDHFHLHLIPRYEGDNIVIKGAQTGQTLEDLEELRNNLCL